MFSNSVTLPFPLKNSQKGDLTPLEFVYRHRLLQGGKPKFAGWVEIHENLKRQNPLFHPVLFCCQLYYSCIFFNPLKHMLTQYITC